MEQFVFEVLVIFVECLALAHSDERSLGNCSSTSDLRTGHFDGTGFKNHF